MIDSFIVRLKPGIASFTPPRGRPWTARQTREFKADDPQLAYYRNRPGQFTVSPKADRRPTGDAAMLARRRRSADYGQDKAQRHFGDQGAQAAASKAKAADPDPTPQDTPPAREKAAEGPSAVDFLTRVKELVGMPAEIKGDEQAATLSVDMGDGEMMDFDVSIATMAGVTPEQYAAEVEDEIAQANEDEPKGEADDNGELTADDIEAMQPADRDRLVAFAKGLGLKFGSRTKFETIKSDVLDALGAQD